MKKKSNNFELVVAVMMLTMFIVCVASWLTHVFTCFADSAWGFLIAGAILFPVAILHGFYIWFMAFVGLFV